MPYKTEYIKLIQQGNPSNIDYNIIIKPSLYVSNRLIWDYLYDDKLGNYTLELNKKTKFMISYIGDELDDSSDYEKYKYNNHNIIVSKKGMDKIQFSFGNKPTNSVITYLPDNFDFFEFRKQQMLIKYNFSCLRINQTVLPALSCNINKPRQQILPTIKFKVDNGSKDISSLKD